MAVLNLLPNNEEDKTKTFIMDQTFCNMATERRDTFCHVCQLETSNYKEPHNLLLISHVDAYLFLVIFLFQLVLFQISKLL